MRMLYLGTAILDYLCIMLRLTIDYFPIPSEHSDSHLASTESVPSQESACSRSTICDKGTFGAELGSSV